MYEIPRSVLVPLPKIMGIDLSITNEVILLWEAAVVTFIALTLACRGRDLVARGRFRNAIEGIVDALDREVIQAALGDGGRRWAPFLLTLFFFILSANLLGAVPLPKYFKAATSSLSVTAGLALVVFGVTLAARLRRHGFLGFVKGFALPGVPWWLLPLVVPIEIFSWLAKPVSLALRLFANMMAGHSLILAFAGLALTAGWYAKALPLAGAVIMSGFELFVAFIQAFIFTLLAGFYIKEAIESHTPAPGGSAPAGTAPGVSAARAEEKCP
jgi:F-type H+-transporting ATPase subunit a